MLHSGSRDESCRNSESRSQCTQRSLSTSGRAGNSAWDLNRYCYRLMEKWINRLEILDQNDEEPINNSEQDMVKTTERFSPRILNECLETGASALVCDIKSRDKSRQALARIYGRASLSIALALLNCSGVVDMIAKFQTAKDHRMGLAWFHVTNATLRSRRTFFASEQRWRLGFRHYETPLSKKASTQHSCWKPVCRSIDVLDQGEEISGVYLIHWLLCFH